MYFAHIDQNAEPLKTVMPGYLFDATPIITANALVGRRLSDFGLANLRYCALDGIVARLKREKGLPTNGLVKTTWRATL